MLGAVSSWLTRGNRRVRILQCASCKGLLTIVVSHLQGFVESIFQLLHLISQDPTRSEGLMRASMGVLG